jgi:uncharacterized protein (DUF4415 family)
MSDDDTKYHVSDGSVLTPAQVARLDAIEARFGDSVDSAEISDAAWATAVRGKHADKTQVAISIVLDADVALWLRRKGPGYREEISRILRERMLQET